MRSSGSTWPSPRPTPTFSSSAQPGNIGVGFSIPINDAKSVAQEIIATGAATHGQLGLSVRAKASGTASGFTAGAEVAAVTQGGAADKAGDATLGGATAR